MHTTAELRKAAREAEERRDYRAAALLYQAAADRYPAHAAAGQLGRRDLAMLRAAAALCAEVARGE